MPNTYPRNPSTIPLERLRMQTVKGALARHQARVSRKARTVLKLQDRTSNQLFRLAAASGALRKKALDRNDQVLANAAQAIASSSGRLAKAMWQEYKLVATAALRITGGRGNRGNSGGVRSPAVGMTSRTGSSRPKGPVKIVDPASLAKLMSKLRAVQNELSGFAARTSRK